MSEITKEINVILTPEYNEACWPITMIWERINHAYTSDSRPINWGFQKQNCGFQYWIFNSYIESYSVVWDTNRSYWKVKTPFGPCLFFIGPLFIDKSGKGLQVPPLGSVTESDLDVLMPAFPSMVKKKMQKIARFVAV